MRLLSTVITTIRKRRAELKAEDTKLARVLQALAGNPTPATIEAPARRKMSKAQREAVSVRMKAYWRKRRQAAKGGK